MELATGFPGYNSLMPKSNGTFAEVLKQNGYNTAWYGKNPTCLTGIAVKRVRSTFDRQAWASNISMISLAATPVSGRLLSTRTSSLSSRRTISQTISLTRIADHAIARIQMSHAVAPDKPWVTYYAPGTAHAPHHAPKEWIAKFKGKFDMGWDKMREETLARQKAMGIVPANTQLTPRPKDIQAWDSLDADQKKVHAHMMEVYAAALSYCDTQMGRIVDALDEMGETDNTLVIYIQGDNGASAEGTPQGLLNEMSIFNKHSRGLQAGDSAHGRPGWTDEVQPLSCRLGARHGHAFPVDQAGRITLRGDAQRLGHLLARSY
jgi:arylsulfatase